MTHRCSNCLLSFPKGSPVPEGWARLHIGVEGLDGQKTETSGGEWLCPAHAQHAKEMIDVLNEREADRD